MTKTPLNENTAGTVAPGLRLPDSGREGALEALGRVPGRLRPLEAEAAELGSLPAWKPLGKREREHLRGLRDGLRSLAAHYERVTFALLEEQPFADAHDILFGPFLQVETARALRSWRLSEYELECAPLHLLRDYIESATAGAWELRRFTSMGDLVRDYRSGGWRHWIDRACLEGRDGLPLWHGVVREAAYWRRACQLIADATASSVTPDL